MRLRQGEIEGLRRLLTTGGGGGGGGPVAWNDVTGKPSTFPPSTHGHVINDVTGLQTALDGKAAVSHTHTPSQIVGFPTYGEAVVTVPNNQIEWVATVSAPGVTPTNRVIVSLGNHPDSDENDTEMLDVTGLSAAPGTDQITVCLSFATPTAGPVRVNWNAYG